MSLSWHLYVMALLYILTGMNHFRKPRMYYKIIPPYLPYPKFINIISGLSEIIFAVLLLFPAATNFAAWGIIVLLILVFPANLFMFQNKDASFGLPKWMLFLRLPLQFVLVLWAYHYTN